MSLIFSDLTPNEKKTFRVDLINRIPDGIINNLIFSAFLLISVKVFNCHDIQKAIITSARNVGLMAGLFSMPLLARLGLKKSSLTGLLAFCSGAVLIGSGFVKTPMGYTATIFICLILFMCRVPYMTSIYGHNYREEHRSVLYSRGILVASFSSFVCTLILGRLMEIDPQLFRPVFIGVGLITMGASIPLMRLPTEKLTSTQSVSPIKSFSILFEDPYFGYFCLIWVIFGLAILSILTMQVLYLAEEDRGLGLSSLQVLLITGVLSGIVKVVANQPMSKLFSRVDIFRFRFIINLVMAAGTFMFFQMDNFWLLMVANIILNIGITGDYLMWGIFVTRVAPPDKTHVYMSVHTFLSGARGIVGPSLAFLFIQKYTLQQFGVIATCFVLVSGIMALPVVLGWWKIKPLKSYR
jgi:hypothetical protein